MCEVTRATAVQLANREAFTRLLVEWRKSITEYLDPATPDTRLQEIDDASGPHDREMTLAWQIVTFPIEVPCLISDKFEVIAHYVNAAGTLDPLTRIVFVGAASIRIDFSHFYH